MMPLKIMVDYLLESFKCDVTVIGIQPKTLEFGHQPTKEIKDSVRQVAKALSEVL
jgi:Ni,Fe-hydrogenase maturation factor